jgi:RIO-like serine/threonine protein kinase
VSNIKKYGGYDVNNLEFLGKGTQGRVYKIDNEKCIKIFQSKKVCNQETKTLIMAQKSSIFPKIYSYGDYYIIREYINGIELDKYLKDYPLTVEISRKIIELYETIVEIGYSRQDTTLFHIFYTSSGEFRIIDTGRVMKEISTYPRLILMGLKKLGYEEEFLIHVKLLKPKLYEFWFKKNKD